MSEEENSSDEELAPMVDGLSGTLCIIILVSMVFIFSGLKTASTYINFGQIAFENVKIDLTNSVIYFKGGIQLSDSDINLLKNELNNIKSENITFYGYIDNKIANAQEKNVYNLLYMASIIKKLSISNKISFQKGTAESCLGWNSCIYWR